MNLPPPAARSAAVQIVRPPTPTSDTKEDTAESGKKKGMLCPPSWLSDIVNG
jgi:hypothetical protein